jgi:hypothetical protein
MDDLMEYVIYHRIQSDMYYPLRTRFIERWEWDEIIRKTGGSGIMRDHVREICQH